MKLGGGKYPKKFRNLQQNNNDDNSPKFIIYLNQTVHDKSDLCACNVASGTAGLTAYRGQYPALASHRYCFGHRVNTPKPAGLHFPSTVTAIPTCSFHEQGPPSTKSSRLNVLDPITPVGLGRTELPVNLLDDEISRCGLCR